jgi:SAM-dependent methyltransferase
VNPRWAGLREALDGLPASERDAWIDEAFGIDELPDDGPDLPPGCVPYLPCPVDVVLRVIDQANVGPGDVFVDIGSGLGRAALLTHFLTGASAIGIEIQPELVRGARELAERLSASRVATVEGDAAHVVGLVPIGTVFFLNCPFSGARLEKVLVHLEGIARTRQIHVCSLHLPIPPCSWLTLAGPPSEDLAVYRSVASPRAADQAASAASF